MLETRPLSNRRRTRRVDRALRAGRTITVREFVEAYCELEETPRGKIVTNEEVDRLRRLATEHAPLIPDLVDAGVEDDPTADAARAARTSSEAAVWYVVAVGPDARSVEDASDVTVIRRLPEAVFACVRRDLALRLRREHRPNVHLFATPAPAMTAFGVFDRG